MNMMDQALQTYIEEGRGLLEEMEAILLRLENEPQAESDPDTINALFRAAHTIKGSAGLFGLDAIVAFTHVVENLLDELRDGSLVVDGNLIELLLKCCDHIGILITVVAENGASLEDEQERVGASLLTSLRRILGTEAEGSSMPAVAEGSVASSGGGAMGGDYWTISVAFGRDVLRNGMDPMSFIRYLSNIGDIISLATDDSALPYL